MDGTGKFIYSLASLKPQQIYENWDLVKNTSLFVINQAVVKKSYNKETKHLLIN